MGGWRADRRDIQLHRKQDRRHGRAAFKHRDHLVERFTLNADGQSLLYSFELTDPVYLAAPLRGELRWLYRPNLRVELVRCDPEATRSFLEN